MTRSWTLGILILAAWTGTQAVGGETRRISVALGGSEQGGGGYHPAIGGSGRFIAFDSSAADLVAGDTNGVSDVFVYDRRTEGMSRVSVTSTGEEANHVCCRPSISADGRYVVFESFASNLVSGDGNDDWDVFVHDRDLGRTWMVSVDADGIQGNAASMNPTISADGRFVAYESLADQLVPGDTNGWWDVFVHDLQSGETTRASIGSNGEEGDWASGGASLSSDGRYVAFESGAKLVDDDWGPFGDIYVRDRLLEETVRVSVDSQGVQGDGHSFGASMSANGQHIAFSSDATNLDEGTRDGDSNVFLHDRLTESTEMISRHSSNVLDESNSYSATISMDGRFIAFVSQADNRPSRGMDGHDPLRSFAQVFLYDRSKRTARLVSETFLGRPSRTDAYDPGVSDDGRLVVFSSLDDGLVQGDRNGRMDVFLHDTKLATALSYGSGWPGTGGVPELKAESPPLLCQSTLLSLENSSNRPTPGVLLLGVGATEWVSPLDGVLWVQVRSSLPIYVPAQGANLRFSPPCDPAADGWRLYLQALQLDPGASKGVSFTSGLRLTLGLTN